MRVPSDLKTNYLQMKEKNKKKILVLTYWDFNDALIQTYTLPYLEIISKSLSINEQIFLVTLNKSNKKISFNHPNIKVISYSYIPFGFRALIYYLIMLLQLIFFVYKKNITHIHAWCTPAGLFGYILSLLTNIPLIIDSYEPHAEAMVEVGEWKKNSLAFRLLFYFEKKMTHHAKYLIATTERMIKEYAVSRYNFNPDKNNWFVKPACVNNNLFYPSDELRNKIRNELQLNNKIVGIYAGKFGGIYLEDEFFEFLSVASNYWKENFNFIILSSHSKEYIQNKLNEFKIPSNKIIHLFVPHKDVPLYFNAADFAVTPVKPIYSKKFCSPIKDGEYWATGLPVIITKDISDDSDIIEKNNIGYVLKELNKTEYQKAVEYIDRLISDKEIKNKIVQIAKKYRSFDNISLIYSKIYS
jgi:hypothetical protein